MASIKHGHTIGHYGKGTPWSRTYMSWISMKQRCNNINHTAYHRYGGRGITVCARWLHSFDNFLKDMGERPEEKTLDRIDTNGNYCKINCKWSTRKEQANNKRNTRFINRDGKNIPIAYFFESDAQRQRFYARIKNGHGEDFALNHSTVKSENQFLDVSNFDFSDNRNEDIFNLRKLKCPFSQIGNMFGISKQRAHQICEAKLKKIRREKYNTFF